MKATQLLAVLFLLAGVNQVSAALKGPCTTIAAANAMTAGTDTCTCPLGTGIGVGGTVLGTATGSGGASIATANGALALCTDLLPGYYLNGVSSTATTGQTGLQPTNTIAYCPAGSYCIGLANAYKSNGIQCVAGGGVGLACTTTTDAGVTYTSASSTPTTDGTGTDGSKGGPVACPSGTASGAVVASGATGIQINIVSYPVGAAASATSPLGVCSAVAAGFYLPVRTGTAAACTKAASGTSANTGSCAYPLTCPTGSYCPAGTTSILSLNGATLSDIAGNAVQGLTSGTTYIVMVGVNKRSDHCH